MVIVVLQIKESRRHLAARSPAPHSDADHPWHLGRAWTAVMHLQDANMPKESGEVI